MQRGGLPIVSLARLAQRCGSELELLRQSCRNEGFFYVCEHGIEPHHIEAAVEAAKRFFILPEHTKQSYSHAHQRVEPRFSRGFAPMQGEVLDPSTGPDNKEVGSPTRAQ